MGRASLAAMVMASLLAPGCGGDAPGAGEDRAGEPAAVESEMEAGAASEPTRYTGAMILDGNPELVLCDTREVLPLDGPALPDLLELHVGFAPGQEPMEGVFVDILAERREGESGPWLDALEVRRAAWEGWGCRDAVGTAYFQATGTEPFWALTVDEGTLHWQTPEGSQQFVHDGPVRMPRGGWEVEGRGEASGATIRVEFHSEPCRNAMSGAWSHLETQVTLNGTVFRGCGFMGSRGEQALLGVG